MEYEKVDAQYIVGKFYCSEKELANFLIYIDLVGGSWEEASQREGGYYVLASEESYVLEFIKLMEEKEENGS